ncbi:CLUMA_CG020397, isoform A [Clunio marinus]|uniref:CLUMA_CG020397, isoform A n=1 Tax=Clunio marinus TaxID=568069 RepID=A0A1J1J4U5_9DIPT|nr:CLUMA_CG020397, isoform A [Clunio marinus]
MRFTAVLRAQHLGFYFKKHWQVQGRRKVMKTGCYSVLNDLGIDIKDPKKYLENFQEKNENQTQLNQNLKKFLGEPEEIKENNYSYNEKPIYLYGDSNVLVEGTVQAQKLLKTLKFDRFPDQIEKNFENTKLPTNIERSFQQSVLVSHLLDGEQQKLAKKMNPLRPMRPFPLEYGITDARKNLSLSTRLINHCERHFGPRVAANRKTINDALFIAQFQKRGSNIRFDVKAETFLVTRKPISSFASNVDEEPLPDISPLQDTISIPNTHFYDNEIKSSYPVKTSGQFCYPHTIMLHYSNLDVKHLFETPVTPDQFESRAMIKGFAAASSCAQSLYGFEVEELPEPVVVQVVQFDGKRVQFGIFQLNTLNLDVTEGPKNYWFRKPETQLYDVCCYTNGRPALTSYNFDVFRLMSVFYNN